MVFKISSDGVVLNTKNSIGVESSEEISNVQIVTGDTIDFGLNYKHLLSGIEKFSNDILTIYVHKSRQFSFVKILETSDTDNVSQVLILSIMNG
jgi:DNA polymerase III sliding clamp (beta) subunit (PCNA family)